MVKEPTDIYAIPTQDFGKYVPRRGRPPKDTSYADSRELRALIAHYLRMPRSEFEAVMKQDLPMIDTMVISTIAVAIKTGSTTKFDFLLNRCGLILDKTLNVNHMMQDQKDEIVARLTDEELIKILKD